MTTLSSRLEKNWREMIGAEFDRSKAETLEKLLQRLERFLRKERAQDPIYPNDEKIFNALKLTPFKKVKVVIIGQDPYHREGEAHGLCFSVPKGKKIPPSLRNIYKEIDPTKMPSDGDLTMWAEQGVLLLNATLTVRQASPGSHQGQGWEEFTDAIIRAVSRKPEPVVFLLWGRCAQKKRTLVGEKHLVLEASHPAPRSAYRDLRNGEIHSFCGCKHFREANKYLTEHGRKAIVWEKT